jgi:hypothetical protein
MPAFNDIEDITPKEPVIAPMTASRVAPVATVSERPSVIFFIPRCFGVRNKVAGVIILLIVLAFLIAGIMIAYDSTVDAIATTPLPQNIPLRKSLPNIP